MMMGTYLINIFSNDVRINIINYLREEAKTRKEINISDLHKEINKIISPKEYVYTNFVYHVQLLAKEGFVVMKKKKKSPGKPIFVKLTKNAEPISIKYGNEECPIII